LIQPQFVFGNKKNLRWSCPLTSFYLITYSVVFVSLFSKKIDDDDDDDDDAVTCAARARIIYGCVISAVAVSGCHSSVTSSMRSRVNEGGWWMRRASRVSRLICIFTRCYGLCSQSASCSASGPRTDRWQSLVEPTDSFTFQQVFFCPTHAAANLEAVESWCCTIAHRIVSVSRRLFCNAMIFEQ